MPARIHYEIKAELVTARGHNEIMRECNRGLLERHRDRNLPRHFEGGATSRYGYAKRSAKYTARKRKKYGHSIPMVFSGRLRAEIRQNVKITATRNGGRLKSRGYFPMRAEFRAEIERIAPEEQNDLMEWAGKKYLNLALSKRFRRQRRKKS